MGTSLGANTALEIASVAPERLRGMVIEMPVLDNALLWSALAFTPLLVALTFGEPVDEAARARGARGAAVGCFPTTATSCSTSSARNRVRAARVLQGLFFGRIAPHRSERRTFEAPDARARSPPRSRAPLLRRRHARRRAAERPPARSRLARGAAPAPRAAHRRDRRPSWTRSGAPSGPTAAGLQSGRSAHAPHPADGALALGPPARTSAALSYLAGNSSTSFTLTWPGACGCRPRRRGPC